MGTEPFVELINVTKVYHQGTSPVIALDRLDLKISGGEFLAITGKSGCGKSTLINIIGGLDSPDRGHILIDGEDLSRMDDQRLTLFRRNRIGIIFQFFNLLPVLNLEENIALPHLLKEGPNGLQGRIDRLLLEMDLDKKRDHKPHELSGGEMQRVAICRAMMCDPQIVFADEPTGSIDKSSAGILFEMIRHLNTSRGVTFVIVTHNEKFLQVATKVVYLNEGRAERIENLSGTHACK